jgi:hypothetical protein
MSRGADADAEVGSISAAALRTSTCSSSSLLPALSVPLDDDDDGRRPIVCGSGFCRERAFHSDVGF